MRRVAAPGPRDQFANCPSLDPRGFQYGFFTARSAAWSMPLSGMPISRSDAGAGSSRQIVQAERGVGRAKCGGDTRHRVRRGGRVVGEGVRENDVWVSACGRLNEPPSVWQSL